MKDRQRWQPEEDALLRAYVKQYGPKEWNLLSHRMSKPLNRDPKSCLERWKNYLKPGLKKGSLSPEEQSLVISLQAKYGNKWKKIAAEVPGRTAKRLGKWWEVFKEKQIKIQTKQQYSDNNFAEGPYDHILETFAEKYVQPNLFQRNNRVSDLDPVLSLGWVNVNSASSGSSSTSSEPVVEEVNRVLPVRCLGSLVQWCKEVEEGRKMWVQHKKEAIWRLSRLEQQLESEKVRKRREKVEEMELKIRSLREEEMACLGRIERDYRQQVEAMQKEAEREEAKLLEAWCRKHSKLEEIVGRFGGEG